MATKRHSRSKTSASSKAGTATDLRAKILEAFAALWSEEGHPPRSVARFCKALGITEAVFYSHFPSLHAVEKAFWRHWINGVISAVENGEAWEEFTARERYLSFLFALTQSATSSRSLLLERFHDISPLSHPGVLEGMRAEFLTYAHRIVERGTESDEIAERRGLTTLYPGILYVHLRWVIDQWLKDESEEFERTDAFIEKTVTLAFDIFRSQALDSAADLIRFLLPGNPWSGCKGK